MKSYIFDIKYSTSKFFSWTSFSTWSVSITKCTSLPVEKEINTMLFSIWYICFSCRIFVSQQKKRKIWRHLIWWNIEACFMFEITSIVYWKELRLELFRGCRWILSRWVEMLDSNLIEHLVGSLIKECFQWPKEETELDWNLLMSIPYMIAGTSR